MIHRLEGDLLLSKADAIVHGVAPGDDFKNGLAFALRERFPSLYKDFRHYCKQQSPKAGKLWLWEGVDDDGRHVRVVSLFTQEPAKHQGGHPGKAHPEYVNHALHELKKLCGKKGWTSIALPRLSTGVGGLDWSDVEPMIERQLGDLEDTAIAVYADYQPGLAADEPFGESAAG